MSLNMEGCSELQEEDKEDLIKEIFKEEVLAVVKEMRKNWDPGPDGFPH